MIELYAKGTTDFTKHGIALAATQASVNWQDSGRYDLDMVMPYDGRITIDYGMILRAPVPVQNVGTITLGPVSYWEISSGLSDVPLYSKLPSTESVRYSGWTPGIGYTAGDKVTYNGQNYSARHAIAPLTDVAPSVSDAWQTISGSRTVAGKVAASLDAGDVIVKTGSFNSTYMKAADMAGNEGFIEIAKCTDMSQTDTRTVPAFEIREQSFAITEIEKASNGQTLTVHAEHISYQLGRVMLGDCNISRATPATAMMLIRGAMQEDYPGAVETNLPDTELITGDFSWRNAQAAILDPKAGFLANTTGWMIRNDMDVYVLAEVEGAARYRITYGTNMKAVKWTGDVGNLVTRIYPIAQREDGNTLLLPEVYIDTVRTVPYIRPEALKTGLKIGEKEKQEDGSEVKLTEDMVYSRMREQAANRFNIDECDKAEITLEVDWQHLPDTAEYAAYAALQDAAPGEWVQVVSGPLGISTSIRMTGYTYDPILKRYKKGTFGKKRQTPSVASYDIASGAVTGRAIASGAVGSANLQAGSITAREIEANSITSDLIAARSITSQLIMANAITADEINAGAVTAAKIAAGSIDADKINANSVNAIVALLGAAHITNGVIDNAQIGFANIVDASVQSLIARDALTDRYFIDKLQVRNAQMVEATVGELVIKASDNNYYRLDVGSDGSLTPTQVTLTAAEIAAGVTSNGHGSIIETDLTVGDLAATNMKGISALIDKITASRIDVDELFARQATINKLNTVDISSNTYLQLYVGENFYEKKSGIAITGDGVEISGGKYVKIKAASGSTAAGKFIVESGNFTIDASGNVYVSGEVHAGANSVLGGWTLGANRIYSGSGTSYVALDSDSSGTYAIWAGNGTASSAPFRVKRDGTVTLTKLLALGSDGTTETEVNLRTAGLWKLNGNTITAHTSSGGYCTSITLTGGTTLNFSHAARTYTGSWSGGTYTVVDDLGTTVASTSIYLNTNGTGALFGATVTAGSPSGSTLVSTSGSLVENVSSKTVTLVINSITKSTVSTQDTYNAGVNSVTISSVSATEAAATATTIVLNATASNGKTGTGSVNISSYRTNAYNSGVASVTISSVTATEAAATATTLVLNATASNGKTGTGSVNISSYRTNAYNSGYSAGTNAVTISSVTATEAAATATTLVLNATASNGKTGTGSVNISSYRTNAYNAGWNECRQAMLNSASTLQYYTGTVSYAYDAPHQSANRIQVLKPYYWNSTTLYTVPNEK